MSASLMLQCTCGLVKGAVQVRPGRPGNRLVCHCNDCQEFARYLERADEILDDHGGTDIYQVSPADLALTDGTDQIACVRLTPNGLLRWYAACCRTPIGNTLPTRAMPFVGLINMFARAANSAADLDAIQGPVEQHIYGRHATGDRSTLDAHETMPASLIAGTIWRLLQRRLRGEHRRSPFFDQSGQPIITPHVRNKAEKQVAGSNQTGRDQ